MPNDIKTPLARRTAALAAALLATLYAGTLAQGAAAEPAAADAKAKLASVRARIADLTTRLGSQLKERDALSARVRESELAVTTQRRRLESLRADQAAAERRRTSLREEFARSQNSVREERAALAAQVRAAYIIGREEPLKLLLNQSNPAGLGRTLTYYGYFTEARSAKIARIEADMAHLTDLVGELDRQAFALKTLAEEASQQIATLQRARGERTAAVSTLNAQLANGNQELGKLKREAQAVESLIADLSRVLQDFPTDPSKSFDGMRGKLPWPVAGKVSAHYQSARANPALGMRWNGIMIDAPAGAKVRAPYFGRVVYADWLQGLGLLLIIAHSGGYMTLYGHAEVLYKAVGDTVIPGDVIAGLPEGAGALPKLYFEIRAGRKTVDPTLWLRRTP